MWALSALTALAAPTLEGTWVPDIGCVASFSTPSCEGRHVVQVVDTGAGVEARYTRTSETFKRYGLPDNLPYFQAVRMGSLDWSGQIASYFPDDGNRCGAQGTPFPFTLKLSADGRSFTVHSTNVQINYGDCSLHEREPESQTWYRFGAGPDLQNADLEPTVLKPDCAAWVAYRDDYLPRRLDAAVADFKTKRTSEAMIPLLREIEQALVKAESEGEREQTINALARSAEIAADRFIAITGLVLDKTTAKWIPAFDEAVMGAYGTAKCLAKITADSIRDEDTKDTLTTCVRDKALWAATNVMKDPAATVIESLFSMGKSIRDLKESDDAYQNALYEVRKDLAKTRVALSRYEEELARIEAATLEVHEINALQLHIAEVCGTAPGLQ